MSGFFYLFPIQRKRRCCLKRKRGAHANTLLARENWITHVSCLSVCVFVVQCKAKFPGRQLVYVSRNWGFSPFPKDVYTDGRQMTAEGKITWKGFALSTTCFFLSFSLSLKTPHSCPRPLALHLLSLPSIVCPLARIAECTRGAFLRHVRWFFSEQAKKTNHMIRIEA